jgi:polyisoprenoid-binding protein YceI
MKTPHLITVALLLMAMTATGQKYITKTGHIKFFSDAPLEKIEANNRQVNSVLDLATGGFAFKVLMKSFEFPKALMQEHFNENYVESDKYPNATFVGTIANIREVDISKDGIYPVTVAGKLTLHGITKEINEKGTLEVKQGKIIGKSTFPLTVADYNITIPGNVGKNIAKTIEITVNVTLDKANL